MNKNNNRFKTEYHLLKHDHEPRQHAIAITGLIIGVICFLSIYGLRVINFQYTGWLMNAGDLTNSYLGWEFFRNDDWRFPLGLAKNYAFPFGVPITYTDSIPLFALFFKIFNPLLPADFQYFGLWGLISFSIQGLIAAMIIKRWTSNLIIIALATSFFTLSPIMIYRMFVHSALAGHWIILLALYLMFSNNYDKSKSIILWLIVNTISVLIHPYLTLMVFIIFIGFLVNCYFNEKKLKYIILQLMTSLGGILAISWVIGIFVFRSQAVQAGLGHYSMNLNALVNPQGWSSILQDLPYDKTGQYEGFQYLGIGLVFLLLISFTLIYIRGFRENKSYKFNGYVFVLATCLVLAISPVVTLNQHVLFQYPLPVILAEFFSIFRASGRLFWPAYYILCFWGFYKLINGGINKKYVIALLSLLLFMQLVDISELLHYKRLDYNRANEYQSSLKSEFWNYAAGEYKNIILLPPRGFLFEQNLYYYAAKNNLTTNIGRFARAPYGEMDKYAKKHVDLITSGVVNKDSMYIIGHDSFFDTLSLPGFVKESMMIGMVDGIIFIIPANKTIKQSYEDVLFFQIAQNVELANYLSNIDDDQLVFIAVKGEALNAINEKIIKEMRNIGLMIDLRANFKGSYYAIVGTPLKGNVLEELSSDLLVKNINKGEHLGRIVSPANFSIISNGVSAGNKASIIIDGKEYSPNNQGLNIVLFDLLQNQVSEIAHFDTSRSTIGMRFATEGKLFAPDFENYEWGSKICFGRDGDSFKYKGEGWSVAESNYSWTKRSKAKLYLSVDAVDTDVVFSAVIHAFLVPEKNDAQRVNIIVNNQKVDQWVISEMKVSQQITVIPNDIIDGSLIEIVFEFPDAVSPAEMGISGERRLLGLAFHSIKLNKK